MPARGAVTLFHVRGIRVGVDYSWFFVLFLIILWLSGFYRAVLDVSNADAVPYLLALVSALAFFGAIVLHELGHALVAMRHGIVISDITLWIFGGVARMTSDSDSPGTEFKMVIAWLASINILILFFNLIPAFPLDGGRIARAIAWRLTGDRNRATRAAGRLGQAFSYVFIAIGLALLVSGDVVGGIWLALIGWMLGQSARGAVLQTEFASRIEGIRVADVMDDDPVAIPEDASVERALDEYFLRYRWPWFPVIDPYRRFLGLIERGA